MSFDLPKKSDNSLAELEMELEGCTRCSLSQTRTKLVFGVGNPAADLMFIGEAPGFHEDQKGEPFVGAAGKLLDQLLLQILGLKRDDIYIGNVLKCRPPENRDPLPDEISLCKEFIYKQIELIDPKIVCTLGNFSTRLLLNKTVYISKVHGRAIKMGKRYVFPIYHPAAALYATKTKELLIDDFKILADLLIETKKNLEQTAKKEESTAPDQLGLF